MTGIDPQDSDTSPPLPIEQSFAAGVTEPDALPVVAPTGGAAIPQGLPPASGTAAPVPLAASVPAPPPAAPWRSVRGGLMEMRVLSRALQDLEILTGGTRAATYGEVDEHVARAIRLERGLERAAIAAMGPLGAQRLQQQDRGHGEQAADMPMPAAIPVVAADPLPIDRGPALLAGLGGEPGHAQAQSPNTKAAVRQLDRDMKRVLDDGGLADERPTKVGAPLPTPSVAAPAKGQSASDKKFDTLMHAIDAMGTQRLPSAARRSREPQPKSMAPAPQANPRKIPVTSPAKPPAGTAVAGTLKPAPAKPGPALSTQRGTTPTSQARPSAPATAVPTNPKAKFLKSWPVPGYSGQPAGTPAAKDAEGPNHEGGKKHYYADGRFDLTGAHGYRHKRDKHGNLVGKAHAGIDLPGPIGTPVYAAADGVVVRTTPQIKNVVQRVKGKDGKTRLVPVLRAKLDQFGKPVLKDGKPVMENVTTLAGFGNRIEIAHADGATSEYGHLIRAPTLRPGAKVKRGDLVGYLGTTGNAQGQGSHLHFGVKRNGQWIDPTQWMRSQ